MIAVAIDGPSGAGKSTIARRAAKALGYIYVDTGALYRAIAYQMLRGGVDLDDPSAVAAGLAGMRIELKFIDGEQRVFANGADVSDLIRTPAVSMGASRVSAVRAVRDFLFELQRSLARENNVIMDGRDIGTVVLPNAQVKIFLTADDTVRAKRRFDELAAKGSDTTYEEVLADVRQRDYNDTHRETAPLRQAGDAVLANTTDCSFEESVNLVLTIIRERV